MAKFKKGDRVRNLCRDDKYVKYGATGTVNEDNSDIPFVDDSDIPFVVWDSASMLTDYGREVANRNCSLIFCACEYDLELIEPSNHSVEPTEMIAPQPNTLEWWRWHYAGQAMQGCLSNSIDLNQGVEPWWYGGMNRIAESSSMLADALISQLQKPKEQ